MKQAVLHHRKFRRLVRLLKPILGSSSPVPVEVIASGTLVVMWSHAYETLHPGFPDADDVADAIGWSGQPQSLVDAFVSAGWLDRRHDGELHIHDLADHAPQFVLQRWSRALASACGVEIKRITEQLEAAGLQQRMLMRYCWDTGCYPRGRNELAKMIKSATTCHADGGSVSHADDEAASDADRSGIRTIAPQAVTGQSPDGHRAVTAHPPPGHSDRIGSGGQGLTRPGSESSQACRARAGARGSGDDGLIVPDVLEDALRGALGRDLNDADRRVADRWRADGVPPSVAAEVISDRADGAREPIRVARWFDRPVREAAESYRPEPVDEERERLRSEIEDAALDADQRTQILEQLCTATDADMISEVEALLCQQIEDSQHQVEAARA